MIALASKADLLERAWNADSKGRVIIGDQFTVITFNQTAERQFASGSHLRLKDGRLIVVNKEDAAMIEQHFLKPWRRRTGFLVRDATGLNPMILDSIYEQSSGAPIWIGVIRQPDDSMHQLTRLAPLAHAYRLTPAEQRIILHICRTDDTDEVATAAGVKVGTVRSHVKSIYLKLGVRSRAALVRLVMQATL